MSIFGYRVCQYEAEIITKIIIVITFTIDKSELTINIRACVTKRFHYDKWHK